MVSVIVPVYGVEPYLPRCIDSIINQTYTDIEIILVDDGSPDKCGQICDEYAQKDNRIRVIHKKNGGLSDARNAGIEVAKGELFTFIDSDDYVAPNMIEHLVDKMQQYDAGIAVCPGLEFYDYSEIDKHVAIAEKSIELSGIEAMEKFFIAENVDVPIMTWGKIYKSELFIETGIRFPCGRIHEDNFTAYRLFFYAKKIIISNQKLYYYLQRGDSIMGQAFRPARLDVIEAAKEAMEFVRDNNLPLIEESRYYYIVTNLDMAHLMIKEIKWRKWVGYIKEIRENIFKSVPKPLSNRYLSSQNRASLFLLMLGCWCYVPAKRLFMVMEQLKNIN